MAVSRADYIAGLSRINGQQLAMAIGKGQEKAQFSNSKSKNRLAAPFC